MTASYHLLSALALLQLSTNTVRALPAETCEEQKGCLEFTITKNIDQPLPCDLVAGANEPCAFTACIKLDTRPDSCIKAGDSFSHVCDQSGPGPAFCPNGDDEWDADAQGPPLVPLVTNAQCQTGIAGASLKFVYKDGAGGQNGGCASGGSITALHPPPFNGGQGSVGCAPSDEVSYIKYSPLLNLYLPVKNGGGSAGWNYGTANLVARTCHLWFEL